MAVSIFTYILLALSAFVGGMASFYMLIRLRRMLPANNLADKIKSQSRYWIVGYILFFLLTQVFEDKLESRFVGESFSYIDERSKIIGIVLLLFIFVATVRGVFLSDITRPWKSVIIGANILFITSLISLVILVRVLFDLYL